MRRPAPQTLADLQHPGPKAEDRRPHAFCRANAAALDLPAGVSLLEHLGAWADSNGYTSAVLDLGGVTLDAFDYVMPATPFDDRHAAWYSDARTSAGAVLSEAAAILGRKEGAWFAHVHACWLEDASETLGHLLPHTLLTASASRIKGWGLNGAAFEAKPDPETEFTLFRVRQLPGGPERANCNALIATLAPFEDLAGSLVALADRLGGESFDIAGLGSLAGACFRDSEPMTGLISEILIRRGAALTADSSLSVPVRAVDLHGTLHHGEVAPGKAPTLITCELVLRIAKDD